MTITLQGKGVSPGIAIGNVYIMQQDRLVIPEYKIDPSTTRTEIQRLNNAVLEARQQLRKIRDNIPGTTAAKIASFIDTHLLMLEDMALTQEPIRMIREQYYNAERALKIHRDNLLNVFDEMDDAYLRTRKDDISHVVDRVQRLLLKQQPAPHESLDSGLTGKIILAPDLTPADTVLIQHQGVAAFATEHGGLTSHTAILARSMGIPAIVGLPRALHYIKPDNQVILDGRSGIVLVDPDDNTLRHYQTLQEKNRTYISDLSILKEAPARTIDGTDIELQANIELPRDFNTVRKVGANGVGLYRTEFLYMNRESPPDEEEHYAAYKKVLEILDGLPLTIRTMDLGSDKQVDSMTQTGPVQANPALGLRAIRLCLKEPGMFRTQLRAILRASAHGKVRLMIPMISNTGEIEQVLQIITAIKEDLDRKHISYDNQLPLGCMIEVPAAAICADAIARQMDFLSIGTNDLIQYTIAIDRVNDAVNYLYNPLHPAVLRLIRMVLDAGRKAKIPVGMCGEMAGDKNNTRFLLGLGLREFSVHPANLLEVKQIITESDIRKLEQPARQMLDASSDLEVNTVIHALNQGNH
jgi:phosphotransferase system enzyme I (PtsI)